MDNFIYAWPALILMGLGLQMALRLHYGARGPGAGDPIYVLVTIVSWVLLLLVLAPLIIVSAFTFLGAVVVVVAVATLVELVLVHREAQRKSMCTLLALTTESGQAVDSSLLVAEPMSRGIVGRAMRRLLAAVQGGMSLPAAIQRHPEALPRAAAAYVAAGRSIEAESAALRELSRSDSGELLSIWRACIDRISYLVAVLMIMAIILIFVMIRIVPEFEAIFSEFEIELPRLTQVAIAASNFMLKYLVPPFAVFAPIVLVAAIVITICYLSDAPVLRFLGDRVFRSRLTADLLRILAVATEHRQPLTTVLERLAYVHPSRVMRRRLAPAAAAVAAGGDWRDALGARHFISRAEQSLLKTAEQVGNLPWALRSIAERREKRAAYRLAAFVQVLYPLVIVLLGACVGFFVVSLFVPIVKLINGLAG